MRIMIDCRMLYGPKRGIAHYLEHLTQALAEIDSQNQYTLFYVSGRADAGQIVRLPYPNVRTRVLRVPNGYFVRLFADSSLPYRLLRRLSRGYDLVHEPGFEPLPLAPRMVLTLHDLIFFRLPEHFSPDVAAHHQRRQRESARNASQIITDSEYTRRDAIELLNVPPEKVHTVHLGVSPAAFEAGITDADAARELAALGIVKPFLLSIGDVLRRKNNITAVRGFALLKPGLRQAHQFVIAGAHDPEVARELSDEIKAQGLEESVLMPGYVSLAARRALMTRAVALVYPSLFEGFGLPPLEAMACGVPTVCADSTSIPEVVGDAGLLVQDYREPEAWAQALERILTDMPLRQEYAARGRERVKLFTWERTARETLKVYELAARS